MTAGTMTVWTAFYFPTMTMGITREKSLENGRLFLLHTARGRVIIELPPGEPETTPNTTPGASYVHRKGYTVNAIDIEPITATAEDWWGVRVWKRSDVCRFRTHGRGRARFRRFAGPMAGTVLPVPFLWVGHRLGNRGLVALTVRVAGHIPAPHNND
jgi:hypothetical protein